MKAKSTLYLVVPCYNEEEVLDETAKQLTRKMEDLIAAEKISDDSRIVFVNDGSREIATSACFFAYISPASTAF